MNKLLLKLKSKIMAFRDMFKDDNDINEKSVVGFSAFAVMVIFAILWITLGSFGIAEAGKIFGKEVTEDENENI
jgi:hypothetical protein